MDGSPNALACDLNPGSRGGKRNPPPTCDISGGKADNVSQSVTMAKPGRIYEKPEREPELEPELEPDLEAAAEGAHAVDLERCRQSVR